MTNTTREGMENMSKEKEIIKITKQILKRDKQNLQELKLNN